MCDKWVIINSSGMAWYQQRKPGGGAHGYSDAAKSVPPQLYIQKSFDDESRLIKLKGSDIHVSWFLHDGNTQIHIAIANYKHAKFDVVILPLNKHMEGTNIFTEEWGSKHYENLFSGQLSEGQIKTCERTGLACKAIVAAIFTGNRKNVIEDLMKSQMDKKTRKHSVQTMGIPIEFNKLYDPMDFIKSIMTLRDKYNARPFTCFLCFKGDESSLVSFMKDVDSFLRTKERTRRSVFSPVFKDVFRTLNVEAEITTREMLEAGCESLVAAIGGDFNLDKSKLTQAIAKEAGKKLQADINKLDKGAYQVGDVIHCGSKKPYINGVKSILLGRLTKWNQSDGKKTTVQKVSNFVKECLLTADDNGCRSVVFPVLGSGYLSYPEDVICAALSRGINKYTEYGMKGNVSKVVISCLENPGSSLYKKLESSLIRCMSTQNGTTPSDNLNNKTDETSEEVTADVNPGITHYLEANNQIENFKTRLREKFHVIAEDNNGKLVLKGSLENILETEKYLDTEFTTEFKFNNIDMEQQGVTSDPEQMGVHPSTTRDPCAQTANDSEYATETIEASVQNLTTSDTERRVVKPNEPAGIKMNSFIECDRKICVFNTDNIFSFETDIKVFITDDKFKNENLSLSQMLEANFECHKDMFAEACKAKRDMEVCKLKDPNTCTCVIVVVVRCVDAPIPKKDKKKNEFKDSICVITENVLKKAEEIGGKSITLPLLVNTGNDAAIGMCCQSMAVTILKYLRQDVKINHVNVLLDSESIVKIFSDAVRTKQKSK